MVELKLEHEQEKSHLYQQHSSERDSLIKDHEQEIDRLEKQLQNAMSEHEKKTLAWRERDAQVIPPTSALQGVPLLLVHAPTPCLASQGASNTQLFWL